MGVLKIDYNRPVIKKVDGSTGIEVYMYLDLPGVYLNTYALPVDDELAAKAGFDIVKYGRMKQKRERLAIAMEAIDHELELEAYNDAKREVVIERGGFRVVNIGLGRHIIEDPEGGKLVDRPLTLEEAKTAIEKLVPLSEPSEQKKKGVPFKNAATAA